MYELGEIAQAVGGEVQRGDARHFATSVSTDSRLLAPGALFVALRGPTFDGHRFLETAAARGAVGALVARDALPLPGDLPLVVVPDTLRALGDLAADFRRRFPVEVVGVTGS